MTAVTCALGPDSAGPLLHEFIRSAAERLDVAVYEAGPSYAWTFPEAVRRGVRVRLLLDGHGGANRGCLEELRAAAAKGTRVPCRVVPHRAGVDAHWKVLAADAGRLAVGTGNLIERDAPAHEGHGDTTPLSGTREWWVSVDGAPTLTAQARARVTRAWREAVEPPRLWTVEEVAAGPPVGAPPAVAPLRLEMASRRLTLAMDAPACLGMLEAALEHATRRVLLTVPYIHTWALPVRPLLARLAELRAGRVDVRFLLGAEPAGGDATTLLDRGLAARVMNAARCTTGHAKGLVVDDACLVMSSNWSAAGLGTALESALRVEHAAAAEYYADCFERDWDTADPLVRG